MLDGEGRPAAVATWDYLPSTVKAAMADLKNVLMTGDLGTAKIVHIERLNIQIGDHNTQINFDSIVDPEIKEAMQDLYNRLKNDTK